MLTVSKHDFPGLSLLACVSVGKLRFVVACWPFHAVGLRVGVFPRRPEVNNGVSLPLLFSALIFEARSLAQPGVYRLDCLSVYPHVSVLGLPMPIVVPGFQVHRVQTILGACACMYTEQFADGRSNNPPNPKTVFFSVHYLMDI